MFKPAWTDASRNDAAWSARLPSATRSCSRAARTTNLRMFTAEKPREMPSSTTCRRWPCGSIASTNGWDRSMRRPLDLHPLDQLLHLELAEDDVGQLVPSVARDEHPAGIVDPDLLDLGIVEEPLQRSEARDPGHQLVDDAGRVGHRCDDSGQAALVVGPHDLLGDAPHAGH